MTPRSIESDLRVAADAFRDGFDAVGRHFLRKAYREAFLEERPAKFKAPPSVWVRLRLVKGRGA